MKEIVREYLEVYRWGRMKEKLHLKERVLPGIVFLIFVIKDDWWGRPLMVFLCVWVPMGFAYAAGILHPVKRGKLWYLCPMGRAERKAFVYKGYFFRCMVSVGVALVGCALLLVCFKSNVWYVLEIFLIECLWACLLPPSSVAAQSGKKVDYLTGDVYRGIMVFCGIVLGMILCGFVGMPLENDGSALVMLLVMAGGLGAPAVWYYVRYVGVQLRGAAVYGNPVVDEE